MTQTAFARRIDREPLSPEAQKARDQQRQILEKSRKTEPVSSHSSLNSQPHWPEIKERAFHGLAGDVVRTIAPHTEADNVALLVQFLAAFGNCIGRKAYFKVEGDRHFPNLFAVMVGESSKSRKGTSWGRIRQLFEMLGEEKEKNWLKQVVSGLSSGEGLIWAVREAHDEDPGVSDKRLLVIESEFANVLRVLTREGNTLSRVIRDAWDRGDLATLTKNNPTSATGAHITIVGHITADELRRYLDRTEAANGFANRFLYLCVKRSKTLPFGADLPQTQLRDLANRLALAVSYAKQVERVEMSEPTRQIWEQVYPDLSEGQPGLFGAVIGRAEAQVIRLALVYSLLDKAERIEPEHLGAAIALWNYAESSAGYVFGLTMGDPVADEIMKALRAAGDAGMTRTDISDLFKGHRKFAQIGRALELLLQHNRAVMTTEPNPSGEGRPVQRWRLADG